MAKYQIQDFTIEDFRITQNYGDNVEYYKTVSKGALRNGHEGVDFATPIGTKVYAPFDGKIVRDAVGDRDYGNFVVIWDPVQKIALWFCHLQDSIVENGQTVKKGDYICRTNNTGRSTGAHCHVNFCETDENGYRLNTGNGSLGFLNVMDSNLVEIKPYPKAQPTPPPPPPAPAPVATAQPISNPVTASQSGGVFINGQTLYTQAEYNSAMADRERFWKERDQAYSERDKALGQLKDMMTDRDLFKIQLTGFHAMGYTTVEELQAVLKEKDDKIELLTKEVAETKRLASTFASEAKKALDEDSTAIEIGLSALQEAKSLKNDLVAIAGAAETKPDLKNMLARIDGLRRMAEKTLVKASKEVKAPVTEEQVQKVQKDTTSFFSKIFGLNSSAKEVRVQ